MADKKNTSKRQTTAKKSARSATKVTVKKAADAKATASKATVTAKKAAAPAKKSTKAARVERKGIKLPRFLAAIGAYFKGAWFELRQVRWPDRKATWSLTLAVILFSVFFAALILGLDYVFQLLFKKILL